MRHKILPIKNVARLSAAGDALINRGVDMPGMGLIWGGTGYGKSKATEWFVNKINGVHIRVIKLETPHSMLRSILKEFVIEPKGSCADLVMTVVEKLSQSGQPLFVDEADYIAESEQMTETLRDIHDLSTVPVILIGMAEIRGKLKRRKQLSGRIAESVEFLPCDREDARILADGLCEVEVDDELLSRVLNASGGSVRLIKIALSQIEQKAKAKGKAKMKNSDWGKSNFFFGDAPRIKSIPQAQKMVMAG